MVNHVCDGFDYGDILITMVTMVVIDLTMGTMVVIDQVTMVVIYFNLTMVMVIN